VEPGGEGNANSRRKFGRDVSPIVRWGAAGIILLSVAGEAAASGGLWCDVDDRSAQIELQGGVTHGMGGPLFSFTGKVDARDGSTPDDLRTTMFERSHVAQYWLDGKELRLLLYRERAADKAHGYVELTILAKANDEDSYEGRYELEVFDADASSEGKTWTYEGKISCGAE
jgi:hypothetical protein